ncbi:MAG: hypothetical protein NTX64_19085 [Elusimicrobia bacterium]|nr:hypothetical protein [Elusimicrobiota bacterium]
MLISGAIGAAPTRCLADEAAPELTGASFESLAKQAKSNSGIPSIEAPAKLQSGAANAGTEVEALSVAVNCHAYPAAPGCPDFCRHHHGFPGCNPRVQALSLLDSAAGGSKDAGARVEALSAVVNCKFYPAAPGCPAFCRHHHGFPGCNPRMEALSGKNCAMNPYEPGCPGYCAYDGQEMYPGCPKFCAANPYAPECNEDQVWKGVEGEKPVLGAKTSGANPGILLGVQDISSRNCAMNPYEPGCPGYCAYDGQEMSPGCPKFCEANPYAPECK